MMLLLTLVNSVYKASTSLTVTERKDQRKEFQYMKARLVAYLFAYKLELEKPVPVKRKHLCC